MKSPKTTVFLAAIGALFILGGALAGYYYRQASFERFITELTYYDAAMDIKWNLIFLNRLHEKKYDEAIKLHERLLASRFGVLSDYATHSDGSNRELVTEVVDLLLAYQAENPGFAIDGVNELSAKLRKKFPVSRQQ